MTKFFFNLVITREKGVIRMKIKSQISDAIKKKLFNTFIINEDVFSLMAEKEQLSDKQPGTSAL